MENLSDNNQCVGDVLLLKSKGIIGKCIIKAQNILVQMDANYTHVAMIISPNFIIHSTANGVGYAKIEDLNINEKYYDNWKVIRNKQVGYNRELALKLYQSANYHFNKKYNFFFSIKNFLIPSKLKNTIIDKTAICSEFVSIAYQSIGIQISDGLHQKIFPCHFENLDDPWEDVTNYYKDPKYFHKNILSYLSKLKTYDIDGYFERINDYTFPSREYAYKFFAQLKLNSNDISDANINTIFSDYEKDVLNDIASNCIDESKYKNDPKYKQIIEIFEQNTFEDAVNEFINSTDKLLGEQKKLRKQFIDKSQESTIHTGEFSYSISRRIYFVLFRVAFIRRIELYRARLRKGKYNYNLLFPFNKNIKHYYESLFYLFTKNINEFTKIEYTLLNWKGEFYKKLISYLIDMEFKNQSLYKQLLAVEIKVFLYIHYKLKKCELFALKLRNETIDDDFDQFYGDLGEIVNKIEYFESFFDDYKEGITSFIDEFVQEDKIKTFKTDIEKHMLSIVFAVLTCGSVKNLSHF